MLRLLPSLMVFFFSASLAFAGPIRISGGGDASDRLFEKTGIAVIQYVIEYDVEPQPFLSSTSVRPDLGFTVEAFARRYAFTDFYVEINGVDLTSLVTPTAPAGTELFVEDVELEPDFAREFGFGGTPSLDRIFVTFDFDLVALSELLGAPFDDQASLAVLFQNRPGQLDATRPPAASDLQTWDGDVFATFNDFSDNSPNSQSFLDVTIEAIDSVRTQSDNVVPVPEPSSIGFLQLALGVVAYCTFSSWSSRKRYRAN